MLVILANHGGHELPPGRKAGWGRKDTPGLLPVRARGREPLDPLIPPHPGLRQDGGPGKALPKPSDGAAYAKKTAEKGITAPGRPRAQDP